MDNYSRNEDKLLKIQSESLYMYNFFLLKLIEIDEGKSNEAVKINKALVKWKANYVKIGEDTLRIEILNDKKMLEVHYFKRPS